MREDDQRNAPDISHFITNSESDDIDLFFIGENNTRRNRETSMK
jgi:hypothetical protein